MVSWCQRQVPPPAGGSCPRSRPGQSGTIPQQVQHPVRRSANPLPPSPHCHCPRHTAWAATGPTTQPGPHAGPCAHRAPNAFSSAKSNKFCMGTHPMPPVLPEVINSAWAHTQCLQFCQLWQVKGQGTNRRHSLQCRKRLSTNGSHRIRPQGDGKSMKGRRVLERRQRRCAAVPYRIHTEVDG